MSVDALRVGVVDDNAYFRRIVRTILVGMGVKQVLEADCADTGWTLVSSIRPDILLCDWNLGGQNGGQLLERIRSSRDDAVATQLFVFVSAHSDKRHVLLAAKLGANDFIVKPISPRILYDRIRRLVYGRFTYQRLGGRLMPIPVTSQGPVPILAPLDEAVQIPGTQTEVLYL
ncbi:response regulator [Chthonobacter albigriseus]|uniref:response regulator n=1 Tax=Chthonobacter albigriseus TaxID=1683161 RepID=UPI0015EF99A4|nr:response regulator [Chthonobacter albigriseus]